MTGGSVPRLGRVGIGNGVTLPPLRGSGVDTDGKVAPRDEGGGARGEGGAGGAAGGGILGIDGGGSPAGNDGGIWSPSIVRWR